MKKTVPARLYLEGLHALMRDGFDRDEIITPILETLADARPLDTERRDHALRAPLTGYRACHVCEFKGVTIVLIYRDTGRRIHWEAIGEHDAAYQAVQGKP